MITPTTPTPDDEARAEAKRLYPEWTHDDRHKAGYHAYVRGRTDERAQIAARRDEVAEGIARADDPDRTWQDIAYWERDLYLDRADAALATLGVSDR